MLHEEQLNLAKIILEVRIKPKAKNNHKINTIGWSEMTPGKCSKLKIITLEN